MMAAILPPYSEGPPLRYTITVGSSFGTNGQVYSGGRPVRPVTSEEISRMRDRVERFGVEKVENVDVLIELNKLNRKALKVFTSCRRAGDGEVEALVKAVWSMK